MGRRKNLVVDANIVCSAGDRGQTGSRAIVCARFLTAILEYGHGVVVTPELLAEWKRHRSRYSSTWLRVVFAKRRDKRVNPIDCVLRYRATELTGSEKECVALLKDAHLVEAAMAADDTVASLDEVARQILVRCVNEYGCREIGHLVWVNPERDSGVVGWLQGGAEAEEGRRLRSWRDSV